MDDAMSGSIMMTSLLEVNEKTRTAYNKAAAKYHELFHNEIKEKEYDREILDNYALLFNKGSHILDAGCGPSGHISAYLKNKGLQITGVDISEECVCSAQRENPAINFYREDISCLSFEDNSFDGIVAYYSIVDTPKEFIGILFKEFMRLLKSGGYLLVTVKEGNSEGFQNDLLGINAEIYFTLFTKEEIESFFSNEGFEIIYLNIRNPYDFEINNKRIFALGKKP